MGAEDRPRKYLFADESGNFDFRDHIKHKGATRYFAVGTVMIDGDDAVQALRHDMHELRTRLAREGVEHDAAFHATEDKQAVRNAVFETLKPHAFNVDVTLLEKSKAQPHLRVTDAQFYKYAWWFHLKYLSGRYIRRTDDLMLIASSLGTAKMRDAFKRGVQNVADQCLTWQMQRPVQFWSVDSDPCLQVADYATWAVTRSRERDDDRALEQLGDKVRTNYDFFWPGSTHYYGPRAALGQAS